MASKTRPKLTAKATDSAESGSPTVSMPDTAVSAIMQAIKDSEHSLMGKITSAITALSSELHAKIESLSSELRKEIATDRSEWHDAIASVNREMAKQATSVRSLEEGANDYSDRVVELEAEVKSLKSNVKQLATKTEYMESRQRRDNCRMVGVEESFGEVRMEQAVAKLLQDSLKLDYTPAIDRAYRSPQPRQRDGDPPRQIMVKFHYFQEKMDVLRKTYSQRPILHNNKQLFIYPDYSAAVTKQRAAFKEARALLRGCPNTRFGLRFPATLKITSPSGEQRSFDNPSEAEEYITRHLQTKDSSN